MGGAFYASKDFFDPVKKRRINWGWARTAGPTNVQTMPREITWHPELQQLVFTAVEEQDSLRAKKIGDFSGTLESGTASSLHLPKYVGNQSEVMVSFSRPASDATLGVKVMVSGDSGVEFTVQYKKGANTATVD